MKGADLQKFMKGADFEKFAKSSYFQKFAKKKELDQLEMKIIDLYLKKKILVYLQDLVSILIPQKESWM